jgi:hypothetical protein
MEAEIDGIGRRRRPQGVEQLPRQALPVGGGQGAGGADGAGTVEGDDFYLGALPQDAQCPRYLGARRAMALKDLLAP